MGAAAITFRSVSKNDGRDPGFVKPFGAGSNPGGVNDRGVAAEIPPAAHTRTGLYRFCGRAGAHLRCLRSRSDSHKSYYGTGDIAAGGAGRRMSSVLAPWGNGASEHCFAAGRFNRGRGRHNAAWR